MTSDKPFGVTNPLNKKQTQLDNQVKCPDCFISADGFRLYRPPAIKNSKFAITGIQANFQQFNKSGAIISNGHLNITK